MRRSALASATILLIACTKGPKGLSPATFDAVVKAGDALQRAWEYREEDRMFYEPRLLEAQKAVEEMRGVAGNAADNSAAEIGESCLKELGLFRDMVSLAYRGGSERTRSLAVDIGFQSRQCIADLRMYVQ